jgi:hypothetical protein
MSKYGRIKNRKNKSEIISSRQLSVMIAKSTSLTKQQHKMNTDWLEKVRNTLNDGGMWVHQDTGQMFEKVSGGWKRI